MTSVLQTIEVKIYGSEISTGKKEVFGREFPGLVRSREGESIIKTP